MRVFFDFKQMGLTVKFFLAPVAALLFMVLLGLVASGGLVVQKRSIDSLYTRSYKDYQTAVNIYQTILSVNETCYKLLSWKMVKNQEAQIPEIFDQQLALVNGQAQQLEALVNAQSNEIQKETYTQVFTLVKEYAVAVSTVKTMGLLSVGTGAGFMVSADNKISEMKAAVYALQQQADQDAQANYVASMRGYQQTFWRFLILFGVSLVVSLGFSFWMARNLRAAIVTPVHRTIAVFRDLAEGNLEVAPMPVRSQDEMGMLAQAFNTMLVSLQSKAAVIEKMARGDLTFDASSASDKDRLGQSLQRLTNATHELTDLAQAMAEGNLLVEVQERSNQDMLMRALNDMLTKLNDTVLGVKAAAENVATGSRDVNTIAEQMSQGASQQAAAAEEASAAMEQMVANIRQNLDNAQATQQIALESAADAEKGGVAVKQTIEAMKAIVERISIIQEIANQTTMLSLNATIEASKAQDFGKGFAVVASEVRELSKSTREAAEEIDQLVRSCEIVSEEAGAILRRLMPNSRKTAELVQEINAASREQYSGAEQINKAVQQLDTVIQQNAATAEEMATAAEELASQAEHLHVAMAFFTVREKTPVEPVRDAHLMDSLQTLLTVDDQQFDHLLKTLMGLRQQQENKPGHFPQEDNDGKPPTVSNIYQKPAARMTAGAIQDELDADFERF